MEGTTRGVEEIARLYPELYPKLAENPKLPAGAAKEIARNGYYWNLLINHNSSTVSNLVKKLLKEDGYSSIKE